MTRSPGGAGSDAAGVVLELLAEGEARTLPQKVRPPAGVRAIALASGVWVAPRWTTTSSHRSPSRHPQRRRAHLTVVVGVEGDRDAVDVSVLRYGDGAPTVDCAAASAWSTSAWSAAGPAAPKFVEPRVDPALSLERRTAFHRRDD